VSRDLYEIIAMLMRYVFVVIGALILFRAFLWLRRDVKAYRKEMRSLPDAGFVGEIVDMQTQKSQPLPREGIIGTGKDCDIRLKYSGVKHCHALFSFEEGKGLKIIPRRRHSIQMDGIEVGAAGYALHGTHIQLGDAFIRIRLFAGLNVPHPAQFAGEIPYETEEAEAELPHDMPLLPFENAFDFAAAGDNEAQDEGIGYSGNYNDAGEMTWQFAAYPLDALHQAQHEAQENVEDDEEAVPYQSPLPRRRRRDRY